MKRIPPELDDLAEQIGEFIQYWGFKRVHGRIWTHLYLANEPLDAAELRNRLRVSKALISMSIADLLEYEVIQDAGKGPRGTQVYRANPELARVITGVLRRRERKMISQIVGAHRLLNELSEEQRSGAQLNAARIRVLGELIQGAERGLEAMLNLSAIDLQVLRQFLNPPAESEPR